MGEVPLYAVPRRVTTGHFRLRRFVLVLLNEWAPVKWLVACFKGEIGEMTSGKLSLVAMRGSLTTSTVGYTGAPRS